MTFGETTSSAANKDRPCTGRPDEQRQQGESRLSFGSELVGEAASPSGIQHIWEVQITARPAHPSRALKLVYPLQAGGGPKLQEVEAEK